MSPAPIDPGAPSPAPTPPQHQPQGGGPPLDKLDDIFHRKFMHIIQQFRDDPRTTVMTARDRKAFIDHAYAETDREYYGHRDLNDIEVKMRALTQVFYKILAEEPWSDEWIRPHDVERKLSRFELHKDSVPLAAKFGLHTPRDAIYAARELLRAKDQQLKSGLKSLAPQYSHLAKIPFDDIEVIYIAGTVSSTATNAIQRDTIYPVSVESVAHILHKHPCHNMTRPYEMAAEFLYCNDTDRLLELRKAACDIVDFAPHLLDNDNISLLFVLLILTRSEVCARFADNGIRIEGSTVSHRRAECMKQKLGWRTAEERKPYDSVAADFQIRVKNAAYPIPRPRPARAKTATRKSSSNVTTPTAGTPSAGVTFSPHILQPAPFPNVQLPPAPKASPGAALSTSVAEPMQVD